MFRAFEERVRRLTARHAIARAAEIERVVRSGLPAGVGLEREEGRIVLSGRGLRRRFIAEGAWRWLR